MAETTLPCATGSFTAIGYRDLSVKTDHVVLTAGRPSGAAAVPLRIQSECLTGEVFGSQRCDCGDQLASAMAYISEQRLGVVVYLRGQEGRGIGIMNKLRAYALQDRGADTVSANTQLGLPVDARDYSIVPHILADLGVQSVELISNNPDKAAALSKANVTVASIRRTRPNLAAANLAYLTVKRDVLGHALDLSHAE